MKKQIVEINGKYAAREYSYLWGCWEYIGGDGYRWSLNDTPEILCDSEEEAIGRFNLEYSIGGLDARVVREIK